MFTFNHRQRKVLRLIAVNLLLLVFAVIWSFEPEEQPVAVAVAKGKQMLDMNSMAAPAIDVALARSIALEERAAELTTTGEELAFVSAIPLSPGEARHWQDVGCTADNCAHVTLYDYANSVTVENVVNLDTGNVAARWENAYARPGGSVHVLPEAVEIAAADPAVQSILGDIGAADPAMVPMSGWLADNACRDQWCVDLTFHDPNGTGRIFHVFVNLEQQQVARTFYTRARPERAAAAPIAQRDAYTDGCHEQYGWNVCWEMTAHDGVNFRDATYGGELIFSSAKIGQIEAWYPSWPGGYRDEIGFSASVPPFGDTIVNDLDDAFEVRQLFTEFTRWPNCICCYRYEQIIRFYADGGLDFEFISYGPGCDDLSVYRPFWRIDLDLAGPDNDQVWLYEGDSWVEQAVEFEAHPVVENLSPEGYKMATADGDILYRWRMARTDPLELDEGYLFGLQQNEQEGEGPIITGPGDTYIPPRQWLNGEPLSGENIILWHVPLLKTKKGGPWWCMPDPEPDFSPCTAILHAVPATELVESTPTPTPSPSPPPVLQPAATAEAATSTPLPTATVAPTAAPTATLRPIEGEEADEIVLNAGCGSCHQIGSLGEGHKVGPDLSNIGNIGAQRAPDMSAAEYIRQSILMPNALIAPQCPNGPCMPNIMPANYDIRLSPEQIDTLVAFLLEQKGAPPTPMPVEGSNEAAPKAFPAPKTGIGGATDRISPTTAVQILLLSLVFLLSLLVFLKGSPRDGESPR